MIGQSRGISGGLSRLSPLQLRPATVTLALLVVLAALAALAAVSGDFPIPLADLGKVLTGTANELTTTVVLEWRLPRIAAAIVVGAALGVAGGLFQTVTRNPLASPDVMGLSNGAFVGMLVALVVAGSSIESRTIGALAGGLVTALVIFALSRGLGFGGFRFIVVGVAISSMAAALGTWLLLQVDVDTALFASAWGAGTLAGVTVAGVASAAALVAVLVALVPAHVRALHQLGLGDDVAIVTGVRVAATRVTMLLVGVFLVCVATTVAGPVAFVALAAPQIAKRLVGTAHIPLLTTALFGSVMLSASDLIAQHALPVTVPVGVVTVVIGGCYLVWFLVREARANRRAG
ncbi:iron chelate uptake ABC transporter family permease subunit [Agreia sp. COWG]|uniref:FecCD family ABC transporter permease n=1 Tax=Agreia sp. COWG TaxID=2773266 RepID=UPI0019251D72|nr:iron chelate uptake ABC transporter family permease subunit [Agreia sp. COWG]CAD6011076.1 iron-enterobactin transporter subunit; membrane component of ABC superfamily [Agreia sp. COWG]